MLLCCAPLEFAAAMLSHGKGVAFHVQPSSGTLQAFQQLIIEITAYNNMWGEYSDDLVCKVGGAWFQVKYCYGRFDTNYIS